MHLLKGKGDILHLAFFIKDLNGKILGGIKGSIYYGDLCIEYIWVSPQLRHQGWGLN